MYKVLIVIILLSSNVCFSQINSTGLVAYYPFNGNANDSSGNGNNPNFNNATLTTDRFGNANSAYAFNGTDSYIRIPNSPSLNPSSQVSLCAWVKVEGFYGGPCRGNSILMKGNDEASAAYKLRIDENSYPGNYSCGDKPDSDHEFFYGYGQSLEQSYNYPWIKKDQWYYVVYTYDGKTANLYVDCKLVKSAEFTGLNLANDEDVFIGRTNVPNYPYWFNGALDDIKIYNRALTESEINTAYLTIIKSGDTAICKNTSIQLFAGGGADYLWSPASSLNNANISNPVAFPNSTTTYFVTVSDSYKCSATDSVKITVNDLPTITKSNDTLLCKSTSVQLFASGGSTYLWSPASSLNNPNIANPIATPLSTTIYYVTVTDANKCSANDSVNIIVSSTKVSITKSNDTSICKNSSVQLFATGGSTYLWSPASSLNNANVSNPVASPSSTTTYFVTATDANKCSAIDSVKVTVMGLPVIIKSNDTSLCKNTLVQLFASGGSTYLWSPAASLSNPNIANPIALPLSTTTYFVTVTNSNKCSSNDSVRVTVNDLPVIIKSNDTSVCKNTSVQLFASGGSIYLWSPAASLSNPNIANPVASPSSTTTYFVRVTDANKCSANDSIKVSVNNLPVITKSSDTSVCKNTSVQLFASGGSTYLWSPAASLSNANIANPVALPSSTTTYFVTVTDANKCSANDSVRVTVMGLPVITKSSDTSVCKSTSVQLFASGGSTYLWSPSASLSNPNIANPFASPLSTTTYFVRITDVNKCSATDSVKITVNPLPAITKSNDTTLCKNTSLQLFASGGSTYLWSPASSLNNANIANPVASPAVTTTYYITVTDANKCSANDSVNIIVRSTRVSITKSGDTSVCKNTSVQLFASGGSTYLWSPASSLSNATISNPIATPSSTITYFVTVSDANKCSASDSIKITVNQLPVITKSNDTSICKNNISIQLSASGGSTYLWSPSASLSNPNIANPIASPSSTTTYFVRVTDANKCSANDSVKIVVNNLPVITKSNDTSICKNTSVQLLASGGGSYLWSPAASLNNANIANPVASPVAATTYFVTVTDANKCSAIDSVKIMVMGLPVIIKSNDTSLCKNTSVQLFASGGSTYLWSPASSLNNANISNPIATPLSTITYFVKVTDANKCSAIDSVKIMVSGLPVITKSNDTSICKNNISIQLSASGGSTYLWSPAAYLSNPNIANPIASPSSTTTFFVTITDANKCSAKDSVKITVNPLPTITKSNDTFVCKNTSVQLFASGGSQYVWSPSLSLSNPNISNPVALPLSTTTYFVTVTDANKCSANDSVKIMVNGLPVITKSNDTSLCKNTSVQLFASGGSTYLWSPASSLSNTNISNPIATPLSTTTFFVRVTDVNKCSATDSVKIMVNGLPVIIKSNDTSLCKNTSVQLFASGGSTYLWSPSSSLNNANISNPVASPVKTTMYYVTVTGTNKCSANDSVRVTVNALPVVTKSNDTFVCKSNSVQLFASGGSTYLWSPATSLSNPNIPNPFASPLSTTTYLVRVTDANKCSAIDSVKIMVNDLPVITKSTDTSVCKNTSVHLFASGGSTYLWSPAASLSNANIPNPIALPLSTTTYSVRVTDINKCSSNDSVRVTVNGLPLITKSNDTSVCKNYISIQLFASGGSTYLWSPASSLNNANISNPVAKPSSTTTYFVTVTDANKCIEKDSVKVTVNPLPTITKNNDTTFCKNNSVQLFATGGLQYVWSPSLFLSNPNISNPIATPLSTTTYFVRVTDANKCSATDSVKIMVNGLPVITKSNDTSLCKNTSVQLFASGGSTYLWSPASSLNNANISNPVASPVATTTYYLKVTDANKCSANDSVKITVSEASTFTVSPDQNVCLKSSKQLSAAGGNKYLWQPAIFLSNPNIPNPIATPNTTTIFMVKIKDSICNDSAVLSTTLSVLQLPSIKASKTNDLDCAANSSQLSGSGGLQYVWQPGSFLNDSTIQHPIAKPATTTLFYVYGSGVNGCKNYDSVTVKVNSKPITDYYIANAFTPNGDGVNDCFGLKYWGYVTELDFSIYNRFGERVFHTNTVTDCWDGRYKGIQQNTGIYIYVIKAKASCGLVDRKGEIVLLR